MNGPFQFVARNGVQTTFYFCLEDGTLTDAYIGVDVVAADSTISKDGGASAGTTNAVVTTNSPFFAITLTTAEMTATLILVRITDASAAVFKDCVLVIDTTRVWDDSEGAEPTAAVANNATFRSIFQHLKRAFLNRAVEDASNRTLYRDDSATVLEAQTVSVVGATKTRGKAA